jgi:3-dehydroquinate dehydratase-2
MKKPKTKSKPKPKLQKYLILHGPNLNLLGTREPEVYGTMTLAELNTKLKAIAKKLKMTLVCKQSNHEGDLIDWIHDAKKWAKGIVFNPGAFTHYSFALRDAVAGVEIPTVEVHLSDIQKREDFRKISVISPVCIAQISGLGFQSYVEGLNTLLKGDQK